MHPAHEGTFGAQGGEDMLQFPPPLNTPLPPPLLSVRLAALLYRARMSDWLLRGNELPLIRRNSIYDRIVCTY